jgi:hypothetical protein
MGDYFCQQRKIPLIIFQIEENFATIVIKQAKGVIEDTLFFMDNISGFFFLTMS